MKKVTRKLGFARRRKRDRCPFPNCGWCATSRLYQRIKTWTAGEDAMKDSNQTKYSSLYLT